MAHGRRSLSPSSARTWSRSCCTCTPRSPRRSAAVISSARRPLSPPPRPVDRPRQPSALRGPRHRQRRPKAGADAHAEAVAPAIREAQAAGAKSLRQIAAALNGRGIATARGGKWEARRSRTSCAEPRNVFTQKTPQTRRVVRRCIFPSRRLSANEHRASSCKPQMSTGSDPIRDGSKTLPVKKLRSDARDLSSPA